MAKLESYIEFLVYRLEVHPSLMDIDIMCFESFCYKHFRESQEELDQIIYDNYLELKAGK